MGPLQFLNHVVNFVAPALWMAWVAALAARWLIKKKSTGPSLRWQALVNFAVCLLALGLGLWFFGHDGKMASYTGMAVLCATSQWFMLRGWKA